MSPSTLATTTAAIAQNWGLSDVVLGALIAAVAGVFGSIVTILGVILANRNSRKQLQMQLKAVSAEEVRKRHFEMRSRVYLEGAEAISMASRTVGSMPNTAVSDADIGRDIANVFGRLAKVQVVGHPDTVSAVIEFQSILTESLTMLWPKRWELNLRASTLATFKKTVDSLGADMERWLEEIKQANVRGGEATQPELWKGLTFQYENAKKLQAQFSAQHDALLNTQVDEQLACVQQSMDQVAKLIEAVPAALASARSELELPGDVDVLRQIMSSGSRRQEAAARALAQRAREMLEATRQPKASPPPPPPPPDGKAA